MARHKSKVPGFVLLTLSQVKARISHGWFMRIYYCGSKQEPVEDQFFDADGFHNLAAFERRLIIYKERICNEENGKTLRFYYKEDTP
jgi:hypothetical protein